MKRDSLIRGQEKENELKSYIKNVCKYNCEKNENEYDIDLVIDTSSKKILIEVEETGKYWPPECNKPKFPSGLMTMPIRKIKYFIKDNEKIEKYLMDKSSINSIEEFRRLYPSNSVFETRDREKEIRLYIKGSINLEYISIIKSSIIIKSLNNCLSDQSAVNTSILKQKNNKRYKFDGNIWFNPFVTSMDGKKRSDPVLLILGAINQNDNEIIWVKREGICKYLSEFIRS